MYTIIGKPSCPFCIKAKGLADFMGLEYTYLDASTDDAAMNRIRQSGMRTVPVIYRDNTLIGGYDDFKKSLT